MVRATERAGDGDSGSVLAGAIASRPVSPRAAWYAVAILWLAYICSFVDRQVLALLVEPVKVALAIGDTQLSLLQGLAFGLFYATMGLPCGLMIDRFPRRTVIACGVAVWSLATIACGFAGGFASLFAARMLVGAGEAVLSPGALSMISDLFPRERRVLALSVYLSAVSVGGGLAMIAGGAAIAWAASHPLTLPGGALLEGWRAAFVLVGLPGLLLALLLRLMAEPARRSDTATEAQAPGWRAVFDFMSERRELFVRHFGAFTLFTWLAYAILAWIPAYFVRRHGWTLPEIGWRYGLVNLLAGTAGALGGGAFATRLRRHRPADGTLRTLAWGLTLLVVPASVATLLADPWLSLALLGLANFCMAFSAGASIAAISEVTPGALRGRVAAVYYLVISLVGLTLGPLSVALCTDYLFRDPTRVGDSIALVSAILAPLAALLAWRALPPFRHWSTIAPA